MIKTALLVIALLIAYSANAGNVPGPVQKAFEQKFPNAASVKWEKENAHEYEASFTWKGEKYSANFSDNGEWLETETLVAFNMLPGKVQSAFTSVHKSETAKAVSKIETSKGTVKYEIEFRQGVKTIELFYDQDGKELKN